ncbi:ethanolamine ammonia-lyase light chain EutC [Shigella flexneri]
MGERPGWVSQKASPATPFTRRVWLRPLRPIAPGISNIHQGGTPPVEAAAVIVDLAKRMLEQKASGINMTR